MALIKCPNCKKEISDTTKKCIHCKKRLDGKSDIITPKRVKIFLIIVLAIIIGTISIKKIITFYNSNSNEHKEIKETSTDNEIKSNDIEETNNNDNSIDDNANNNVEENKQEIKDTKKDTSTNNNTNSNKSNTTENTQQKSNSKSVISASETKTCNSGYILSSDKSSCEKTIYINGNTNYICGAGFELVGTKCKSSHTTTPSNGQCYGLYTLENDVCVMYIDATTSTSCPSGYDYANTSDYMENKCSKIEKVSPSVEYSCPSGYTLNGTNCEK